MRSIGRMVCRCLLLTVLVACGPVKGNPPGTDAPADSGPPGFEIAVLSSRTSVPLDGKSAIDLAITRTNFDGEITVAAVTPPNGLMVEELTIAAGETTGELVVGALSPLAIGDTVTFTVEGTATDLDSKSVVIDDADITGRPGSLDDSFGIGTGYASVSFGSDDGGSFNALDLLGGNVIATGIGAGGLGASRFSTMRFTATGAVDSGWNGGALLRTTFIGSSNEDTRSAGIGHQLDGRPILIGSNHSGPNGDIALARLSTSGTNAGGFDFGNQADPGEALLDLGGEEVVGSSFFGTAGDGAVLPDGRIVAVGVSIGHHVIMLAGIGGNLDTGFNTTGFFRDVLGTASIARRVAIDGDGKIVVAGTTSTGVSDEGDLTLHRYTTSGLDPTFGAGGRTILTTAGISENVIGLAILPTGKIILGSTDGTRFQLRRFNSNGMIDTTFGTAGLVETVATGLAPRDLLVLANGKIVILAQNGNNAVLVRFRATGVVDSLFGTDGVVNVPFGDSAEVNTFMIYDSHKIVIAGGNVGGVPGPGTKGLVGRVWM